MHVFKKNRRNKYQDFSKHFNTRLHEVDPEGSKSSSKYYINEHGEEVKKLRKRRGKKKKQQSTTEKA